MKSIRVFDTTHIYYFMYSLHIFIIIILLLFCTAITIKCFQNVYLLHYIVVLIVSGRVCLSCTQRTWNPEFPNGMKPTDIRFKATDMTLDGFYCEAVTWNATWLTEVSHCSPKIIVCLSKSCKCWTVITPPTQRSLFQKMTYCPYKLDDCALFRHEVLTCSSCMWRPIVSFNMTDGSLVISAMVKQVHNLSMYVKIKTAEIIVWIILMFIQDKLTFERNLINHF